MSRSTYFAFLLVCLLMAARTAAQPAHTPSEVDVILWFDTEDYISKSDDDADKRVAELLTQRHIRATFKVVGEKARVLESRGRNDVIDALKRHDIGYHANFHSVHPTVAEYEADCGLLDGMAEFVRREGPGAGDVCRIFGRKSLVCYGQPGSSWAAQAIAALPQCGIENDGVPCYVDSGDHVGFGGAPFWYEGALVVYKMEPNETRMELFSPRGLEQGEKDVAAIAQRLQSLGGGLISIYYHPCEWVTSEFWDAANFSHGRNPPRSQWKLPAQRPSAETDQAFARFGTYINYIHDLPGVRFVTASQLPQLYRDRVHDDGASTQEITQIAALMQRPDFAGVDDVRIEDKIFAPAEQFDLLTRAVAGWIEKPAAPLAERLLPATLLGPDSAAPQQDGAVAPKSWDAFAAAVLDVRDHLKVNHRIPSRVFLGPDSVAPSDFLVGLSAAWLAHEHSRKFPDKIALGHGVALLTARHVARNDPKLFGGWIIHTPNLRPDRILEVARLQAWTLKPALRRL
jgi:hypothetical protein